MANQRGLMRSGVSLVSNQISGHLTSALFANAAGRLKFLDVAENNITAVPLRAPFVAYYNGGANMPLEGVFLNEGVLACNFLPTSVHGCLCSAGYSLDLGCGFARCIGGATACPVGRFFNLTNCSLAPSAPCEATGMRGCEFRCGVSNCGDPVQTILHPFDTGPGATVYDNMTTLDLRNRGITSLHDNAFSCWVLQITRPTPGRPSAFNEIQGVLLDNNPLGMLPASSVFDSVWFVSLVNCSITSLLPGAFINFTTNANVNLARNQITDLPSNVFADTRAGLYVTLFSTYLRCGSVTDV